MEGPPHSISPLTLFPLETIKGRYPSPPRWLFGLVAAAALAIVLITCVRVWNPKYGLTRFLQIGTVFNERGIAAYRETPKYMDPYYPDRWGFDGQYYAELSLDPFLRDPRIKTALDDPAYRSRRILLPWIAHALGLGHPFLTLNLYAALNPIFWVGYVALLYALFRRLGWAGLGGFAAMLLTCGVIECMKGALTDFPAFVLMTLGLVLGGWAGACAVGLAGLTREVTVVAAAGLFRYRPPWGRAFWRNLGLGLVCAGPFLLWYAYVLLRLRERTHGDTDNLGWPFVAMIRKFIDVAGMVRRGEIPWTQFYKNEYVHAILTMIAVVTQSAYLLTHRHWQNRIWRVGALFIPFFFCIGNAQWESHFTITRQALPITLAFNLMLAMKPTRRWWIWFVLGNCFVPYGISLWWNFGRTVPRLPEVTIVGAPEIAERLPDQPGEVRVPAVGAHYGQGWSGAEWNTHQYWRWEIRPTADVELVNHGSLPLQVQLDFTTTSIIPRDLRVMVGPKIVLVGSLNPEEQRYQNERTLPFALPPGTTRVDFETSGPMVAPPGHPNDPRKLGFMLSNLQVNVMPAGR